MAKVFQVTITRHTLDGKRCPKGTPGAVTVRDKSRKWYGSGVPGYPATKRFPLSTDRRASEMMIADLIRGAARGAAGLPDQAAGRKPLANHLVAFADDMALGLATRSHRKRVPSPQQVTMTVQRIGDALTACRLIFVADLNAAAPAKLARYLQGRVAAATLSHQTAAFVLAGVRRFVWWLSARVNAPVRADLFEHLPGFDPAGNRVHDRRAATPEELTALLTAARAGKKQCGLAGEDRYFLYLVAFATGFRKSELHRLTPGNFDLTNPAGPTVYIRKKTSTSKRGGVQPLPPGVARQLADYLRGRPATAPLWPGQWHLRAPDMLRYDLKAGGVAYAIETPTGTRHLDFHALRHSFISALAAAGVGPRELQELARHSDPRLTLGVYTHSTPARLSESVGRLDAHAGGEINPLDSLSRADLIARITALEAAKTTESGCEKGCLPVGLAETPRDPKTPAPATTTTNPGTTEPLR